MDLVILLLTPPLWELLMKMFDLLEIIRSNGIIGAGGAGFPTHVKLSGKAEYVLFDPVTLQKKRFP